MMNRIVACPCAGGTRYADVNSSLVSATRYGGDEKLKRIATAKPKAEPNRGEVSPEAQRLLDKWADGKLANDELIEAAKRGLPVS
jgi:hypothetical protein